MMEKPNMLDDKQYVIQVSHHNLSPNTIIAETFADSERDAILNIKDVLCDTSFFNLDNIKEVKFVTLLIRRREELMSTKKGTACFAVKDMPSRTLTLLTKKV